jgi:pimeloyl-ACP methyl ester carboxylesterase
VERDREITYAEYGRPEGEPIVFLHGTPGSHRLGELLAQAARENGIRVLAPDRPGYGRSSPWPDRSVRDATKFITPVLDDADVQTAGIVAFSGGSPYALSLAAKQADRIDQIDIISGATPPTVSEEIPTMQRVLAGLATTAPFLLRGVFRGQAWFVERMGPSFVLGQYTESENAVTDDEAAIVKADFVEAFANHRSGVVTEFRNTNTSWGIDFTDIEPAVRLWHGGKDTNVPISAVRELEEVIPSAKLHVLPEADHLQTLLRTIPEVLEGYR